MGKLIDGRWQDVWYATKESGGRFVRGRSTFRGEVTADGSSGFRAEPGRYHLYVSYACPWAHRTLVFRALKGLEDVISVDVVHPFMGSNGWTFQPGGGATGDSLNGFDFLHQVYTSADPGFTGRVTVPVLWDKHTRTVVNNESSEIIRMLNSAFDAWGRRDLDLYPEDLREAIDAINPLVYRHVNNGVYKCGFATTQEAYDEVAPKLFETLDLLEARLDAQRYLCGDRLTEADIRLWTTLVRFDPVYHTHFKCNLRRIVDYPNLAGFTRELYQLPGIAETVHMDHIRGHYYRSHESVNPHRIVPIGPVVDFAEPHGRDHLPKAG